MDVHFFLIISHLIGTVLGVGGATFAEIFHTRALKDGVVNPEEGATLKIVYRVLRVGLVITVFSGFGFLLLFRLTGMEERLLDPKLWAKMTIVGILLVNALLLQAHRIPLWLGASLSLASWYAAMIIGAWRGMPYSYWEILFGYVLAVAVVAVCLEVFKKWYFKRT